MQITDEQDYEMQMAEQAYNDEQAERAYAELEAEWAAGVLTVGTEDF